MKEFDRLIAEELAAYSEEMKEAVFSIIEKQTKKAAERLRKTSPKSKESGKHYASGWTVRTVRTKDSVSCTVYNSAKPQLTHLLENGHLDRSGKRVEGTPHISPAETETIESIDKELDKL